MQALGIRDALLLIDAGEDDAVGKTEAFDQIALEDFAAERIGARFEDCPKARMRIDGAQRAQGFANGGWVVGEIVDDGDAADFGANFETALDALEAGESCDDCFFLDALTRGKRGGSRGVECVVLACQLHFQFRPKRTVMP